LAGETKAQTSAGPHQGRVGNITLLGNDNGQVILLHRCTNTTHTT
jgi:hypothetical protein